MSHRKTKRPARKSLRGASRPKGQGKRRRGPSTTRKARTAAGAAREHAHRHLDRLYEISKVLADFESVEESVREVLSVMALTLPIRSAVLIEETGGGPRTTIWHAPDVDAARLEAAEANARKTYEYLVPLAREAAPQAEVSRSGMYALRDAIAHRGFAQGEDRQSFILLPLVTERLVIFGAFQVEDGDSLDSIDLAFVGAVVNQVAVALDRHGALRREVELRERAEALASENARLLVEAQAAVQAREDFVSIASHELKTPLTALELQAQILLDRRGATEEVPEGVQKTHAAIARQVRRLSTIVTNLLDIAKISVGDMELDLEVVDLSALVREVAERFEPELERAKVALKVDAGRPVVGRWNRSRLEQVITNFLSNALKYGEKKPIDVTVEASGKTARLTVHDRGVGIAPQDRGRIFRKYERTDAGRKQAAGLGLGLFITREIVKHHGGSVSLESAPGQGTTFTVELPMEPPAPPSEVAKNQRA